MISRQIIEMYSRMMSVLLIPSLYIQKLFRTAKIRTVEVMQQAIPKKAQRNFYYVSSMSIDAVIKN